MPEDGKPSSPAIQLPGAGLAWQDMTPGLVYLTSKRTIAEADIVQFVNSMGFIEPLFMDLSYVAQTQFGRRIAPGLLVLSVAEGLVIQTGMLHSTGLALLGLEVSFTHPTYVGDTLQVSVEVTEARPSRSGPERGVVTTSNLVTNDRSETVLAYQVVRLIRGRQARSLAAASRGVPLEATQSLRPHEALSCWTAPSTRRASESG